MRWGITDDGHAPSPPPWPCPFSALLAVSLIEPAAARPAAVPADPSAKTAALTRLLERRIEDPRIGGNFAMMVTDAATGEVIWSHEPDNPQRGGIKREARDGRDVAGDDGPGQAVRNAGARGRERYRSHLGGRRGSAPVSKSGLWPSLIGRQNLYGGELVSSCTSTADLFAPPRRGAGVDDRIRQLPHRGCASTSDVR